MDDDLERAMTTVTEKLEPGQVVEFSPTGTDLKTHSVRLLIRTNDLEVLEVAVPSGKTIPTHEFSREVIVHCLDGRVRLVASHQIHELAKGQLILYVCDEPFSILALENATLLIIAALSKFGENVRLIG